MIARELTEFFAGFAADARPVMQRSGDPTFLSNVNACYARACWEEIRFRDLAYSEDQAFGADMLAAGWIKVYQPAGSGPARPRLRPAGVHAPLLRRVPRAAREHRPRRAVRRAAPRPLRARAVVADRRWMDEQGLGGAERARWTRPRDRATTPGVACSRRSARALSACPAPLRRGPVARGTRRARRRPRQPAPARRRRGGAEHRAGRGAGALRCRRTPCRRSSR